MCVCVCVCVCGCVCVCVCLSLWLSQVVVRCEDCEEGVAYFGLAEERGHSKKHRRWCARCFFLSLSLSLSLTVCVRVCA